MTTEERDTFYKDALRLRRNYYAMMKAHPQHANSEVNKMVSVMEKIETDKYKKKS